MDKNRFKQLLESTMGNVKPLIMEQDGSESDDLINKGGYSLPQDYHLKSRQRGCTDPKAVNYNKYSTTDDGSCKYENEFEWVTDYDKGINMSIQKNLPSMLFFTGSDWCSWCKKLKLQVFDTPEFKKWAKNNIIPIELDSPRNNRDAHKDLETKYNVGGYPTVVFLDVNQNVIGKSGYNPGGASSWISDAESKLNIK